MKSIGIFISFLLFISCTAMEYSTTDNLIITIKDLEQKNPSSLENSHKDTSLPPLQIPIFVVESFEKIKDCADQMAQPENLNKNELLKQTLLLSLNNAPSFNANECSVSRFKYLDTFFKLTHALYMLNVTIIKTNKHGENYKHCTKICNRGFQGYLDMKSLSIDDFINTGRDLDYLGCDKEMLRLFAHFCFDNGIYSKILSRKEDKEDKEDNNKIKQIKRILKENALSIANTPLKWNDSTSFSVRLCSIRTLHGIKHIAANLQKEKITEIHLENNYLTSCEIAKICKHFKYVKYFFYGYNPQIKKITIEDLNALSAIKGNYLNLSSCPLTDFPIDHLYNIQPICIEYTCSSMEKKSTTELRTKIKSKIKEIKKSKIKNYSIFNHLNYSLFYLFNTLLYAYGFTQHLDLYKKYEYNPPVHIFEDGWVNH